MTGRRRREPGVEYRIRSDGSTAYRVAWRVGGTRDGERQSETFTALADARDFRARLMSHGWHRPPGLQVAAGRLLVVDTAPGQSPSDVTFRAWSEKYVDELTGVSERYRADCRRDLERHMNPVFGDLPVADVERLDRSAVRRWVNNLEGGAYPWQLRRCPACRGAGAPNCPDPQCSGQRPRPAAPKTIHNLHGLLYAVLQEAVTADPPLRRSNPCDRTRLPRLDDGDHLEEMVFLTPQEFALVCRHLPDEVDRALATLLVGTGLRWSEATALHARHVQLLGQRPRVTVALAWKRTPRSSFELGPPKTRQSRRTVSLSPAVVESLIPLYAGKDGGDLLFQTARGNRIAHSNWYDRRWRPAVAAAQAEGLAKRPRIHDLRHTHVAWLIEANRPLPSIQRRLGHKSITTTIDRYGHLLPTVDEGDLVALEAALRPAPSLVD